MADDLPRYVLYVDAREHNQCVAVMRERGLAPVCKVQDVRLLPDRPAWMHPLPIMLDTDTRKAFRGDTCKRMLQGMTVPPELARAAEKAKRQKQKADISRAFAEALDVSDTR